MVHSPIPSLEVLPGFMEATVRIRVIWRIEMLGQLQVRSEQQTHARFQTHRPGVVLVRLALPVGQTYDRVFLAESIWSNTNLQSARKNLRTALTALRNQLEPPGVETGQVLEATRSTIRLRPETVTTDVAQFDALLAKADKTKATDQQQSLLTEAIALYRGHPLPGYYDSLPQILKRMENIVIR